MHSGTSLWLQRQDRLFSATLRLFRTLLEYVSASGAAHIEDLVPLAEPLHLLADSNQENASVDGIGYIYRVYVLHVKQTTINIDKLRLELKNYTMPRLTQIANCILTSK